MTAIDSILHQRMKKSTGSSKMAALAERSAAGDLTSFSGVFSVMELSVKERETIEAILQNYAHQTQEIQRDLQTLVSLTSEVKAINNQAALLHGERIKRAHQILVGYREGAFTAWLIAAYGNRQTPYNFMQYYEFCEAMPKELRPQIEWMPRQAVYVLASREGPLEKKRTLVENYQGETKGEMLTKIRQTFPLDQADKRQRKTHFSLIEELKRLYHRFEESPQKWSSSQKKELKGLLEQFRLLIEERS